MQVESLAIVAGRNQLPQLIIENCQKNGTRFLLFLLASEQYHIDYSIYQPIIINYGEIEKFFSLLKEYRINNVVFAGSITKPSFANLKVDKTASILLAKILANKILGDDAVLKTVIKFFEKHQLKILNIQQVLDCIISEPSILTTTLPNKQNLDDINLGIKAIKHLSDFDVGQSVVVAQKQIIAVEAVEGTDAMILRCQNLQIEYVKQAILVKMAKSKQTSKADLPTIGIETVLNCHRANICGIAIEAKKTIIIDKQKVIDLANQLKLFIIVK